MKSRLTTRMNMMLERHLPEQRLFLKSDDGTRFIRLRPATQAAMITGMGLFVGWTIIVTSIFLIDTISAGNVRETGAARGIARAGTAERARAF